MDSNLAEAWFALCHRCNVGLANATSFGEILTAAYQEPHRRYHTLAHIQHCLGLAGGVPMPDADRDAVEFALWFHDVVYDPRLDDNEARSAVAADSWLAEMGLSFRDRVADLVRMTAGHQLDHSADLAAKVVHDVDLAILGSAPATYDEYARDIRTEYSWLTDGDYKAGRAKVLTGFVEQSELYVLEGFAQMFGDQARTNIARELAQLTTGE